MKTYSKVKRINRGYVTQYTTSIKLSLRDQDYSNMIIEEIKVIIVITIKYIYHAVHRYERSRMYKGP